MESKDKLSKKGREEGAILLAEEDQLAEVTKAEKEALTPWERVEICRHPDRLRALDIIHQITDRFEEFHGDRLYRDDEAIVGGIAEIKGQKFVVIGQEKGSDTESRLARNFGMPHPEGYRKALRLMELAEKFELPVLSLIDTPGAYPGLAAEERGQGAAIAVNLQKMARLKVPLIGVILSEGCSGGALGIGVVDALGMLEHAYYSVISPEGCASILWKDAKMKERAAEALKMQSEELYKQGVIDAIIEEPLGGAHLGPRIVSTRIREFVLGAWLELEKLSVDELLERRYQKFRTL